MIEAANKNPKTGGLLGAIERLGNKLPDPAVLFIFAMLVTWVVSWLLGGYEFEIPKKTGPELRQVADQLAGGALVEFLGDMVKTFTGFKPLGIVLVALLGVGVAEKSGFINAVIKALLGVTPAALLTPMLILVGIFSHSAADAGYVLVIGLDGVDNFLEDFSAAMRGQMERGVEGAAGGSNCAVDVGRRERLERLEDLELLVADGFGLETTTAKSPQQPIARINRPTDRIVVAR